MIPETIQLDDKEQIICLGELIECFTRRSHLFNIYTLHLLQHCSAADQFSTVPFSYSKHCNNCILLKMDALTSKKSGKVKLPLFFAFLLWKRFNGYVPYKAAAVGKVHSLKHSQRQTVRNTPHWINPVVYVHISLINNMHQLWPWWVAIAIAILIGKCRLLLS